VHRWVRSCDQFLAACFGRSPESWACIGLPLATLTVGRYTPSGWAGQIPGLCVWLAMAMVAPGFWLWRQSSLEAWPQSRRVGRWIGILWCLEIVFNNGPWHSLNVWAIRAWVDNGVWLTTTLLVVYHAVERRRAGARRVDTVKAAATASLLGGVYAALTALAFIHGGLQWVIADPISQAEWSTVHVSFPLLRADDYFAYETLAGAIGHVLFLGLFAGTLIGGLTICLPRSWVQRNADRT